MQWVASTLHTTSEHGVSNITTADAAQLGCQQSTKLTPTADLKGLVRFAETRNLFSARVPSHFNWGLHNIYSQKCMSFCRIQNKFPNSSEIWKTVI